MSNEILKKVEILYEDADCVVVNKPAGLMVHPDARSEGPFLTDWIVEHYPQLKGVGETQRSPEGEVLDRPGIVHRLDKDTTGAILIAKSPEAHAFFKKQFQDKTVSKKYLTFVWGEMEDNFGTITKPIGRSDKHFPRWSAGRGTRGELRDAETYWTKLWAGKADVPGHDEGKPVMFSLMQAEPRTGRTHQIRVHFLAIQHPVVSDETYNGGRPKALGFKRQALHSWKFEFTAQNGKRIKLEAPLPPDFASAIQSLGIKIK